MRNSAIACGLAGLLASPAAAQTIDDIGSIGPVLDACVMREVSGGGFTGRHDVTLRLAFRRDGSIIGQPSVTFSMPRRGEPEQERYIGRMIAAFSACTPLPFSKALGGAIAGKIFTFRYTSTDAKDQNL